MIEAEVTGAETVRHGDLTFTGADGLGRLARHHIGEGMDPATRLVLMRDGRPALAGSLAAFAGQSHGGGDSDPRPSRWTPHPRGQYPDALLRWHARRPARAPRGGQVAAEGEKPLAVPPEAGKGHVDNSAAAASRMTKA